MYIAFDIGGTNMRLASSRDGETIDTTTSIKTPSTYEEGIELLKKAAYQMAGGEPILALAGGIAGVFSQKQQMLMRSPNLPQWIKRPICSELETSFNAPVYIENDAALGGLGEAHRGAGRGAGIVAYFTISTGVGGARIVNGNIDAKSMGFEPGHQIIDADKTVISDARGVLLQDYISGNGIFERTGKKPKDIQNPAFWNSMARMLAFGLNNACVFWSPDVIVLGGSMITGDPAISVEKTKEYFHGITSIYPELPEIKISELGDSCGLHGALEYVKIKREAREAHAVI